MIHVGIAGIQHHHVQYIYTEVANRRNVEIVAVSEPDPVARARAQSQLGVPGYADHREMLDRHELDVVVAVGEYAARGRVVVDGLRVGAHVLADKPICTSLDDLVDLERAWRTSDRELSVLFEKRLWPPTQGLRDLIDNGELGDATLFAATAPHRLARAKRPAWFFDPARYGGILNDLAVHDLDLMLWLTPASAGLIQGWTGNRTVLEHPGFEDHGLATFHDDGGTLGTFEAHWLSPDAAPYHGDYRLRVTGTEGTAEVQWKDNRLVVATHKRRPYAPDLPPRVPPAADFFDAICNGERPTVTGEAAIAATSLALASQRSAAEGRPIRWRHG